MGKHSVGPKISYMDEMFGRNLFLSDKIMIMIVKKNAFRIDRGRLV